ncbi:MAG: VWA domain-containing protein [Planctomycetota bacterium]|nr:VWA domain-containing protein [Planctomycetota bacterium]
MSTRRVRARRAGRSRVVPPSGDGPWSLEWKREGMELAVGGKRYTAITRDAFEKVRRGGGDIASEADKADRVAARPPEATTQRINETSFFGLRGGGKRICFIVDVSGSMAGPKLDRLKQELVGTIQSLKPDTQFAIVFFDSFTNTISQQWMKTDADRQNAVQVITNQGAGSGTDPTGAFEFAFGTLNPLPDCIYYMTDGQTNADVVGILRLLNKGPNKTTVHAIAFGDQSLEMTMKQIAADNNGAYLFVP